MREKEVETRHEEYLDFRNAHAVMHLIAHSIFSSDSHTLRILLRACKEVSVTSFSASSTTR